MLGGTFSPPHIGHLEMARATLRSLSLDEIVFIPCGDPPHKEGSKVWGAEFRLEMTKLLIKGEEKMTVSDMEIRSDGKSYTAKTLARLNENNPDTEYYFIVGADSLCYMDKWKSPEIIFKNARIAVVDRKGYRRQEVDDYIKFLEEKYNAVIYKIFMEAVDISSSDLRQMLAYGKDISKYTGQKVYSLIMERKNGN